MSVHRDIRRLQRKAVPWRRCERQTHDQVAVTGVACGDVRRGSEIVVQSQRYTCEVNQKTSPTTVDQDRLRRMAANHWTGFPGINERWRDLPRTRHLPLAKCSGSV